MNCQEYLALHSELIDERLATYEAERVRAHADECPTCARYDRVLRRGRLVLKALPEPTASADFQPRLEHRLFHLETDLARDRVKASSAVAALGIAAVIALAAWSPMLAGTTVGDQEAILASESEDDLMAEQRENLPAWWSGGAPAFTFVAVVPDVMTLDAATTFPGPYSPLIISPPVRGGAVFLIDGTE